MQSAKRIHDMLLTYSVLLFVGALGGLVWINLDHNSYHEVAHFVLNIFGTHISLHWLVNDVLMPFFLGLMVKEAFEAIVLKKGSLHDWKKALPAPGLATAGGVLGPIAIYLFIAFTWHPEWVSGWAIPTPTDITFGALMARLIFGKHHPAVTFLTLVAILDDVIGVIFIAIIGADGGNPWWVTAMWLTLIPVALLVGRQMAKRGVHHWFWYVSIVGGLTWVGLHNAGLHTVLALIPAVLTMPHADTDLGAFAREELNRHDTLSEFEHFWRIPVEYVILPLFGLFNAGVQVLHWNESGVELAEWHPITTAVLVSLVLGKALGIWLFTTLGLRWWPGASLPTGMSGRDILPVGFTGGIGFTVLLFMAAISLPPGELQDGAKLAGLISFLAVIPATIASRLTGVVRKTTP